MAKAKKAESSEKASVTGEGHFIVGIGASAGGLEAIHEFFDNVPADYNELSFVIIQHLSPDYKSLMAELLTKHTKMKVSEANDGMMLEKNCVYVIPNKKNLIIRNGKLVLIDKNLSQSPNTAIDIFLESLAEEKGNHSIAVILSGTGTDGTRGIGAIQKRGGLVVVQDPATAKFDGMPNSAISSGKVDFILPPELMFDEISTYIKQGPLKGMFPDFDSDENQALVQDIIELIRNHTTYDFVYYKRPTINRRIMRRMMLNNIADLKDYLDFLYATPAEITQLCKEFLIGVTRFFRDKEAWEIIRKKVLPDLILKKYYNDSLKIWVAGCSTGEEAYSLAIAIKEELSKSGKELNVKIFATDIDKEALEFAAKGCYPDTIAADVSPERLERFFVKEGAKYTISPHIRKMVIFAHHDLIKDPPFSRMDLISCRNLLIYLNPVLQKKVLGTFHFALNLGGYLFLGSSETAGEMKSSLADVDKKWKIYKNIQASKGIGFDGAGSGLTVKNIVAPQKNSRNQLQNNFTEMLNETLLEEFGYAGIYVDENFELIHAVGDFKKFIQLPDKKLNLNLLKMVPEEMMSPLSSALRKAVRENEKGAIRGIRVKDAGTIRVINIVIRPFLDQSKDLPRFVLVLFEENPPEESKTKEVEYYTAEDSNNQRIQDLEFELKETKENLQSAIEELETSNEELQSANEELLSANEELQSTNEELQSLNEELHTVNSEHQLKIKELMELNDDLNNYFRSSEIGQVFVDTNMLIRKFTPAATRQINLIETDIGRPINHISNNIRYEKLVEDIKYVAQTKKSLEKEIQLNDSRWYLMRIIPYVRQDKRTDGVIVTFLDVTKLKELNDVIYSVLNSSLSSILAFKAVRNGREDIIDFQCLMANRSSETLLGSDASNLISKRLLDELPQIKTTGLFEEFVHVVNSGRNLHLEKHFDWSHLTGYFDVVAVKMGDGLVVTFTDITGKKVSEEKLVQANAELQEAQRKLQQLNSELERRVEERTRELRISEDYLKQSNETLRKINNDLDNFIYTASHDLRAPISNIEGLVDALNAVVLSENNEAREILGLMRFSVEKFKETIKDLTEISRIQKEKTEDIQEVHVSEILDEVKDSIKDMIERSGALIRLDIKEEKIRFSRKNLRSIFYNLLSNAIKYRASGRLPEVFVTTEKQDDFILLTVKDNGLGIPHKHQDKIFTMFKRFHDHVDGTGVGLYIVKRILDNEGGHITVESEEGKGSTFKVYFKITEKEEALKSV